MDTRSSTTEGTPDRPWLGAYPAVPGWTFEQAPETLPQVLDDAVRRFGARPAMDFFGRRWTYAQLGSLVDRAAEGFRRLGVTPGARVGLCLPNTPYFVVAYFGALKAGAVVVNFNPLNVAEEMAAQARDAGCEVMLAPDLEPIFGRVMSLLGTTPVRRVVACRFARALPPVKAVAFRVLKRADIARVPRGDDRVLGFEALVAGPPMADAPPVRPEDLAVLQYTGGTTGAPKGVMLTHANLTANLRQVQRWFTTARDGEERTLAVLPFFHVFAMTVAMNASLGWGAEIVMLPRYELRSLMGAIRRRRPTVFRRADAVQGDARQGRDEGAARLHPQLHLGRRAAAARGQARLRGGERLHAGRGLRPDRGLARLLLQPAAGGEPRRHHRPAPAGVEAEIRASTTRTMRCRSGARGALRARAQRHGGYWNRPDETAKVLLPGGWLRTGDVGIMDADGYVQLVDRIKDLILCSGFNVYPAPSRRRSTAIPTSPPPPWSACPTSIAAKARPPSSSPARAAA
jgi:long-chain acyl-CoA synthetase